MSERDGMGQKLLASGRDCKTIRAPKDMNEPWASRVWKILRRIGGVLLLAFLVGVALNRISISLERSARPAGFARGIFQGALMPMSMPNLLVGNNVTIYSERNTGLPYKLGYTMGVNVCGLGFFGFFFWRLNRWRK